MLRILGWRQMLLTAALMLFMGGCYTVVSRSTPPERVASRTEVVEEPASAENENAADDRGGQASEDQYSDTAEAAEDEDDSRDNGNFGIRAGKYTQRDEESSTEYQDLDGKTIINNYYDYPGYSRYGYDSWEWCSTPYYWRPYLRVGIVYDPWDPFYWHDPWSWGFGYGWYGSYRYDPWYWGGEYSWDPWYRYSWHNHNYDPWYYGGGGYGGGDGGYDSPRRVRPDRLAGFGTGRTGVVNAGGTVEKTTSGSSAGVTTRRGSRDGFGATDSRRRTSPETSGVATGKPADTSTGANAGTSERRGSNSGENAGRQRVRSGETGRRYQVMDDPDNLVDTISRPVRKEGDSRYRWKNNDQTSVQREATPGTEETSVQQQENTNGNVRQRTQTYTRYRRDTSTSRARENSDSGHESTTRTRGKSTETSQGEAKTSSPERSGNDQSAEKGSTQRSRPTYSTPERSSGSSPQPSYSPPSSGGSRSGGASSRPSGSQSGSRRR